MQNTKALDNNTKLEIIYRVESGCLGPVGHTHIDKFCEYAQKNIENKSSHFIRLTIMPRHDKSLPEMQFKVLSKKVSHAQAEKYLSYFGQSLDSIECDLSDQLTLLIKRYAEEFIT
jgi:hypothetical protein